TVVEREGGERIAGQMFPVAELHGLGECQALRSEGLLRQLEAVERGIVRVKLVVEWHLLLEFRATVPDHAGDMTAVLRLETLDAHGSHAVEHPDLERLAPNSSRRAIVNHGSAILEGDDPGVRERTSRGPGDEPAQRKDAPQGPGIAEPENDVSIPQDA